MTTAAAAAAAAAVFTFHSQYCLLESVAAVLLLESLYELIRVQEGAIGHAQHTSSTMVAVEHKHLRGRRVDGEGHIFRRKKVQE